MSSTSLTLHPGSYFESAFPSKAITTLLTRHYDLTQREFAMVCTGSDGNPVWCRFQSVATSERLHAMLRARPVAQLHIGPIYSHHPARATRAGDTLPEAQLNRPIANEFKIDLDLTDVSFLRLLDARGEVDVQRCRLAWPYLAGNIFLLKFLLKEAYGYDEVLIVWSGRRGVHLYVLDRRAMEMDDATRDSVANYLNFSHCQNSNAASKSLVALVKAYGLEEVVEELFVGHIDALGLLDDEAKIAVFVDTIGIKHDLLSELSEGASEQQSGNKAYKYIRKRVLAVAKLSQKMEHFSDKLLGALIGCELLPLTFAPLHLTLMCALWHDPPTSASFRELVCLATDRSSCELQVQPFAQGSGRNPSQN